MGPRLSQVAAALAVGLAVLAGCSPTPSEDKLLASAREYLDKKDYKAATIQLKTALQGNPQSAAARLLLGRSLLATGDASSALVELRKAKELGVKDEELLPDLARAMLAGGEHAKLLAEHGKAQLADAKAGADFETSLAIAHAMQNEPAKAREASERALQRQPGFVPALLLQARLKASERDFDAALALLDGILAKEPGEERAGVLKGELLMVVRNDAAGALASFRDVLAKHPSTVPAHVGVINILGGQGKAEESRAQFAELKKAAPNHPDTLYLEAQQAYRDGKFEAAREIANRLLKGLPDSPRLLMLAGGIEQRLRNPAQAEAHLSKALKLAPGATHARRMLAQVHLRAGEPARALEVLAPLIESPKADGGSLAMAGEAYLQTGDAKRADDAFKRAAQAAPDDPEVRTSVAIGQLAKGDASALGELEAAAAADKSPRADLALVTARMRAGDSAGALKAITALETKIPDQPLPDLLRARLLLGSKDVPGATTAFDAALKKDPKYFPAISGLANIDLNAGRPDAAKQRFEALAKSDPANAQAHIALAELAARRGAPPADVTQALQAAVKANPAQPQARVLLVEQQLRSGEAKAALASAQDALAALPADAAVQDALGRAQMAGGDAQQALSTFGWLAAQQPKNALVQLRLADAHMLAKDPDAARKAIQRAITIEPDSFAARRGLAVLALQQGCPAEATAVAREWQQRKPKDASGFALEGEVLRQQGDWSGAARAYQTALGLARTTDHAIKLHRTLIGAKRQPEAERLAATWRKEQPKDTAFLFYLGETSMAGGDLPAAEAHYKSVVEIQPRNALALNNLAWVLAQQGKPGAVAAAEEANRLLPARATLIDTLATALASEKQLDKAIETQKKALELDTQRDPNLRLNLARLYIQSGDKPKARSELEELARLGDKFGAQAQVGKLLESVR